jgi:hypothetical protein
MHPDMRSNRRNSRITEIRISSDELGKKETQKAKKKKEKRRKKGERRTLMCYVLYKCRD